MILPCAHCDKQIRKKPSELRSHNFCSRRCNRGFYSWGERHPSSKLSWSDIGEIRGSFIPRKTTQPMLAKKYGVTVRQIANVLCARNWTLTGKSKGHRVAA